MVLFQRGSLHEILSNVFKFFPATWPVGRFSWDVQLKRTSALSASHAMIKIIRRMAKWPSSRPPAPRRI
jgi:hypothetical protein